MNCFNHPEESAVAVCLGCGIAICRSCVTRSADGVSACSPECIMRTESLASGRRLLIQKATSSFRISAWFCWLLGGFLMLFALVGLGADDYVLASYTGISGAVMVGSGFLFSRAGRKGAD